MGAQWLGSGVPRPNASTAPTPPDPAVPGLSRRESAVAELLGRGLTNQVIAARLGLSATKVADYVSSSLFRLGARDRPETVRIIRKLS